MALDRFFREHIFDPLSMKDTDFSFPEKETGRLATVYQLTKNGGLEARRRPSFRRRAFLGGGGALYSTAGDYLQFCQMLANGGELNGVRLLSPRTVDLMMMNHVEEHVLPPQGPNGRPGYGFGLGGAILMNVARSQQAGSVGEFTWAGQARDLFLD